MGSEYYSRIEKYINTKQITKQEIGGMNAKVFFRLDDDKRIETPQFYRDHNIDPKDILLTNKSIQDSELFGELFKSLMSHNNHYVTSFNELFNTKLGNYYIPKFVPVLCKYVKHEGRRFSEIFGSRLSNALGVETVYNLALDKRISQDEFPNFNFRSNHIVVSVDFLASDCEYSLFEELIGKQNAVTSLSILIDLIGTVLPEKVKKIYNFVPSQTQIDVLKQSFVKQYLFRRVICGDTDFTTRNSGVVFNKKTKEISLLPNFDMEFILEGCMGEYEIERIIQTMRFCAKSYPEVLDGVMYKLRTLDTLGELKSIVKYSSQSAPEFFDNNWCRVRSRLAAIYNCYDNVLNPYYL